MRILPFLLATQLVANEPFSLSAEYLCLWMKNSPVPTPLISEFGAGPSIDLNALPPGQVAVIGSTSYSTNVHSGVKAALSIPITTFGIEASYTYLTPRKISRTASSDGSIESFFLLVPYYDVTANEETSDDLSLPGMYAGYANFFLKNGMQMADLALYAPLNPIHLLVGFKWWHFFENISLNTTSNYIDGSGDYFTTQNSFKATNNFYGPLFGLSYLYTANRFHIQTAAKVSLGALLTDLSINGSLDTNFFTGSNQTFPGGYFALPTNMGSHSRSTFAVIPEATCTFLFDLKTWASLQIGYTFLYVNQVLWAGNTVDSNINPTQAPVLTEVVPPDLVGPPDPIPRFNLESFYVQGLTLGLSFFY